MTVFPPPPLDIAAAAQILGMGKRTLEDRLKAYPYYERRGNRRVFYPEHIDALRKAINECGLKSNGLTVGRTSTAQALMVSELDALSKLVTLCARKKPAPPTKRGCGKKASTGRGQS